MQTPTFSERNIQLSLDDINIPKPLKSSVGSKRLTDGIADRTHAALITKETKEIRANEITYHGGEINQNTFSLKFSYSGRSYVIRGIYRLDQMRSFSDRSFYSTVANVTRFEAVNTFRDGRYVSAFLPKKEYDYLTGEATKILSSPFHNPMMQS